MGLIIKAKRLIKQFPFIYPIRIIASCKEWIDKQNIKGGLYKGMRGHAYELKENSENHALLLPRLRTDSDAKKFSTNIFYQTAPVYLFYLKDCHIFRQMGLVLSNRGAVFQEFTHHFNISSLSRFLFNHPFYTYSQKIKKIDGIGAMLVSPQSHNYYHWLFDVLPRIKLYNAVLDQVQYFCISAKVPQKFIDILTEFGIPANKVLLIDDNVKLHFDALFVASLPGSEGRSPKWGIDFVREKLLKVPQNPNPTRKLYFRRGDHVERKILNEESVITLLSSSGFEIIEPGELSITEQIDLMHDARIVVALHGAALGNLLFASDKCSVIEIFSPDYFRTDCYFTLARILNLNYHYLLGIKPANAPWGDITVNETEFAEIIEKLIS